MFQNLSKLFLLGQIPKDLTAIKMVLNPKRSNTLYKLLSKLIVLRLKKLLPFLVHLAQSDFILGSRATYNCIIELEMIHLIYRNDSLFNFFIFPSK